MKFKKLSIFNSNTSHIFLFIKTYLLLLCGFSLFRIILFLTGLDRIGEASLKDIILGFIMGIRFDTVITSYILILPFLIVTIQRFFFKTFTKIKLVAFYYIVFLSSLAFLVCAVDIPYFNQFYDRFSISAFQWMNSPLFIFKMALEEPRYWGYFLLFFFILFPFFLILHKYFKQTKFFLPPPRNLYYSIFYSIVFFLLILVGIRGRIEAKSPIRVGTAYFSNNSFINQLGLNPNFTLIHSYLNSLKPENKKISFLEDSVAIKNVQDYLMINEPSEDFPLNRKINFNSPPLKNNVVVILMESMSAEKMHRNGNIKNLTPFLDSISKEGIFFENFYTTGIHTYNGIFSTLFSYPVVFKQHPMKGQIKSYPGIASTLKKNGYSTYYFTTHDGQFDNVEGFLRHNNFEEVIKEADYPAKYIKTTLGVPDDFMFEFSIPILNKLYKKEKPFLAVFLTASDHGPYYIPPYFIPKSTGIKDQIIEYADFSLKEFFRLASKQEWFENTLFVLLADHGAALSSKFEIPLTFVHSPLIFFKANENFEKKTITKMASQMDVYPSIMGFLKIPYGNKTMGIDLFKESREFVFFNADEKYGVINQEWLFLKNPEGFSGLYKYRENGNRNFLRDSSHIVEEMKIYAESHYQTHQFLKDNYFK